MLNSYIFQFVRNIHGKSLIINRLYVRCCADQVATSMVAEEAFDDDYANSVSESKRGKSGTTQRDSRGAGFSSVMPSVNWNSIPNIDDTRPVADKQTSARCSDLNWNLFPLG